MPSSLTMSLSTPQYALHNHVCPFTVRVPQWYSLADFLGSRITSALGDPRGGLRTIDLRLNARASLRASTPMAFNGVFRNPAAVPLLRPRIAHWGSNGMLTVSAIGIAIRRSLRTRLTPGRRALPGKPWSCGGGGSHPPCRYLYLHLPFHKLHTGSRP